MKVTAPFRQVRGKTRVTTDDGSCTVSTGVGCTDETGMTRDEGYSTFSSGEG